MGIIKKISEEPKNSNEPNDKVFWIVFAIGWAIAVGGTILGFAFKLF